VKLEQNQADYNKNIDSERFKLRFKKIKEEVDTLV
jgi:hypothetical protein